MKFIGLKKLFAPALFCAVLLGLAPVVVRAGDAPSTPALKIDTGDTAWMIVATALVMLMSIPGLALFYGGLAKRKDSRNTMAMPFAAITVARASGAYIERMKFSAWILFSILWMTIVYVPVAHWVWGGGFLARLGGLHFAGGALGP